MELKKILKQYWKYAALAAALAFVFMIVYSIHYDYHYPYHTDEWQNIAQSVIINDRGYGGLMPYFSSENQAVDLEMGFHFFLSELFLTTGINFMTDYQFLPALFAVLAAFILFVFVKKASNFWTAVLSVVFFAGLRSNVNMLGLWFFVPLTLAIPLIYLLFFVFSESIEKSSAKLFYLSLLILLALFAIHGSSAVFAIPVMIIYSALSFGKTDKKFRKHFILSICLFAIFALALAVIFWKGDVPATFGYFKSLFVFTPEWTSHQKIFNLLDVYAPTSFLLACIGLFCTINPKKRIFLAFALFAGLILELFYLFQISFFAPYQRVLYYMFLALAPLSAFGLSFLVKCIMKLPAKLKKLSRYKDIFVILCAALILVILAFHFTGYYETDKDVLLYHHIENPEYEALKWVQGQYGSYKTILAMPGISTAIYPAIKDYVITIIPAHLGGGPGNIDSFFSGDCEYKLGFLKKYPSDFVLYSEEINCDFLEKVYSKAVYMYKVNL